MLARSATAQARRRARSHSIVASRSSRSIACAASSSAPSPDFARPRVLQPRLRARVSILEQLTVRLFAILSSEHTPEVKAVVENLDQVFQNAKGSELFGADLTPEIRGDLFNMTTNEWARMRAQIMDSSNSD